ncbi:hypothetical protein [Chondromyces apiculatus]|uniref:Uncharacterized protein n=1 Tax=Chondromyces apiculatus DSM 436 TaxID=1192034 RepID=A0A017T1J8_9BACT|nr:hypothetical protein [Chondromyces apiculatus]EYF02725.1 Hypothetical protein CAP_6615 [Chondromyces apiculatus DSM 436]
MNFAMKSAMAAMGAAAMMISAPAMATGGGYENDWENDCSSCDSTSLFDSIENLDTTLEDLNVLSIDEMEAFEHFFVETGDVLDGGILTNILQGVLNNLILENIANINLLSDIANGNDIGPILSGNNVDLSDLISVDIDYENHEIVWYYDH